MKRLSLVSDGEQRLRKGIEAQVRQEFKGELAAANYWQRLMIGVKIRREAEKRAKQVKSPYSLWSSLRIR